MKRTFASLLMFGGFLMLLLIAQLNSARNSVNGKFCYRKKGNNEIRVNKSNLYIEPPPQLVSYQHKPREELFAANVDRNMSSVNQLATNETKVYTSPTHIMQLITQLNKKQRIINSEKFGPVTNETVLITVQVHSRLTYLRYLVDSLRAAVDISSAIVVFSHDIYDEDVNKLVRSIDFCRVMQIFYPQSIQTHQHTFPGEDPNDCPRNIKRTEAERMKCNNYNHPDLYGHYREAKFTQMKHHWWWKLNRIFDQLHVTKHHNGFLLLLEEDHYVAEDFISVFKQMQAKIVESCAHCNIISLGTYTEKIRKGSYDVMDGFPWTTNKHNMGMAFNRTTWNAIRSCAKFFCEYDEYNYDFSLQNVNRKCLEKKLFVDVIRGPRVYHIGECGVHHKNKDCNADEKLYDVLKSLNLAKKNRQLYPKSLRQGYAYTTQSTKDFHANGGWGDIRDHKLCLDMTINTS